MHKANYPWKRHPGESCSPLYGFPFLAAQRVYGGEAVTAVNPSSLYDSIHCGKAGEAYFTFVLKQVTVRFTKSRGPKYSGNTSYHEGGLVSY
ncbi:MAG: hypothetical protein QW767_06945, partial [Thermoprotei archaeon]